MRSHQQFCEVYKQAKNKMEVEEEEMIQNNHDTTIFKIATSPDNQQSLQHQNHQIYSAKKSDERQKEKCLDQSYLIVASNDSDSNDSSNSSEEVRT